MAGTPAKDLSEAYGIEIQSLYSRKYWLKKTGAMKKKSKAKKKVSSEKPIEKVQGKMQQKIEVTADSIIITVVIPKKSLSKKLLASYLEE